MEDHRGSNTYRGFAVPHPPPGFLMPVAVPIFPFIQFADLSSHGIAPPPTAAFSIPLSAPMPHPASGVRLDTDNPCQKKAIDNVPTVIGREGGGKLVMNQSHESKRSNSGSPRVSYRDKVKGICAKDASSCSFRRTVLSPIQPSKLPSDCQKSKRGDVVIEEIDFSNENSCIETESSGDTEPARGKDKPNSISGDAQSPSPSPLSMEELLLEFVQDLSISQGIEDKLTDSIKLHGQELNGDERKQRDNAVAELEIMAERWIQSIADRHGEKWCKSGQLMHIFGSYRLHVSTPKSDLDCVLLVPRFISREDFFHGFRLFLQQSENIRFINAIQTAFVPVIKVLFKEGFEVDLLVCRMESEELYCLVQQPYTMSGQLLTGMDERCVRSLNGLRVTEALKAQVIDHNCSLEVFRTGLRAVRMWAHRRGIYSNVMGYLGGVSWAILVCWICQQQRPPTSATELLRRFFMEFSQRDWENNAVILREVERCPSLPYSVWDPTVGNGNRFMPIITPVFPAQNSAYNVTRSGKNIIVEELRGAKRIMDEIDKNTKTWNDLFAQNKFIHNYNHFIVVSVGANSPSLFYRAASLTESRLRDIVLQLETLRSIRVVQVGPDAYNRRSSTDPPHVRKWVLGIRVAPGLLQRNEYGERDLDLRNQRREFLGVLKSYAERAELDWQNVRCEIGYFKKQDLFHYLDESSATNN